MIWFNLAWASFPGAEFLWTWSADSVPASIPKPFARLVRMSAVGELGVVGSWSLRSSGRADVGLEDTFGVGDGTAGDRGC
jgi:hypothetical protein